MAKPQTYALLIALVLLLAVAGSSRAESPVEHAPGGGFGPGC